MDTPDPFTHFVAGVEQARARSGPENLVLVRSVASTNLLARAIVTEYEQEELELHPLLIVALEQRDGRGRQGRTWESPAGKGIYATRVLWVDDAELLQMLPLVAGVGLCRALGPYLPVPCRLKWPNDLVVESAEGRRKIGGILIEAIIHQDGGAVAIIGFGVNYGHAAADLPETGTSLRLLGGGHEPLSRLAWDLTAGLEGELARLGDTGYAVASYRELSVHRPGDRIACRVGEETVEGTFLGFDDRGRLRLLRDGEERLLAAGEVLE